MMNTKAITKLDAELIKKALYGGLEYLELNHKVLDNLNVFPVPDGDTGVNMLLTIKPSTEKLYSQQSLPLPEMLEQFDKDVTNNSRGNSGFILSRFFCGFLKSLLDSKNINTETIKKAFLKGSYEAKVSLMSPVEGTMITIISEISKSMAKTKENDIITLFSEALEQANKTLYKTPNMLPTLAKAGVVDAGALGFIFILKGMLFGLTCKEMIVEDESKYRFPPDKTIIDNIEKINFRYCTEVLANVRNGFGVDDFKSYLQTMGDSIALLYDKDLLKIHIHTNDPQKIIEKVTQHGTIIKDKIENMDHQVSIKNDTVVEENFSILAIVPGEGFTEVFSDLGVGHFLIYDKLPSVLDILEEINLIKNNNIILLPNDKNIIPVALQIQRTVDKNIAVVLTKNVVEGISALYGYNEYETFTNNIKSMNENINLSIYLKINRSAMDVNYGDIFIQKNDFFITKNESILATGPILSSVVLKALESFDLSEKANITFYYNNDIKLKKLEPLKEEIPKVYNNLEIDIQYGGQKKSELIVAIE